MKARRPLTEPEERRVVEFIRTLPPRDRALITTQLFTGFRIAEVLSLTVGQVHRNGRVLPQIGVAPRRLKGKRGATRWVPVVPELERALKIWVSTLLAQPGETVTNTTPLFAAGRSVDGTPERPMSTSCARGIIKAAFRAARVRDDGRLGTHTLRKTFARKVFVNSGNDLQVTRIALGHTSIVITERYLECRPRDVQRLVLLGDWTRAPRKQR